MRENQLLEPEISLELGTQQLDWIKFWVVWKALLHEMQKVSFVEQKLT